MGEIFEGVGGGCNFYIKNKLKSEIFHDKKSLSTKKLFSAINKNSNWKMLTKNLVIVIGLKAHSKVWDNF